MSHPRVVSCALLAVVVALGGLVAVASPASAQSDTAALAAVHGRSRAQIQRLLTDPRARIGPSNRIYYEEKMDPPPLGSVAAGEPTAAAAAPFPYQQTFALHSRPGSRRVIYLDFDGHTVAGTAWNDSSLFGTPPSFYAEPFSVDASTAFSIAEHDIIQSVWQRVSEDYAVFDVDVTTEDPGQEAITRSGSADLLFGSRALITNTSMVASSCGGCSGVAYLGTFDVTSSHAFYQPALVFNLYDDARSIAQTAAHEVGHNFDLTHDATSTSSYYSGHGLWGPIMGSSFNRPVVQWSKGEYIGANNTEDDLAVIQTHGGSLLPDDHGSTAATATPLTEGPTVSAAGIITTDADVDVFRVGAAAGPSSFAVTPAPNSPNLDVLLELRNEAGDLVARSDPPAGRVTSEVASGLDAAISLPLPSGGDYFLSVSGVGTGDPSTGYSGYGSIGRYTLTGSVQERAAAVAGVTSSLNPSIVGDQVTFAATVSARSGSGSPTGQVTFNDGVTALCSAVGLGGGQAGCTSTFSSTSSHAITAVYGGDPIFARATSPVLAQIVNPVPTAVAVTSSTNPSVSGQTVDYTATVSRQVPGPGAPTGTVTFNDGASAMCTAVVLSAGQAICTRSRTAGSHSITVVYAGGPSFAGATSPALTHRVDRAAAKVGLSSSSNPAVSGVPLTLAASVSVLAPGTGTPTGAVTFMDGASPLCVETVAGGSATCTATLAEGRRSITATYSGSSELIAASSATLTIDVTAPPPRSGYWMLGSTGTVYGFGDAVNSGGPTAIAAANIASTPSGNGYWVVSKAGNVFAYGDAGFYGDRPALRTAETTSTISPTPDGTGYWLFTSQGRVFTYGSAQHLGDLSGTTLSGPVLGSAATPSGNGYYMVASDGGIFAFGDAAFRGSMGGRRLSGPVVGLAPDPDGIGYWLVATDGGIFAFDAAFRGSMGGTRLNRPVVGMVAYGDGYLMVAADGGIFSFSSKPFVGSLGSNPPLNPIIAVTPLDR